jgi:hypothetical protein
MMLAPEKTDAPQMAFVTLLLCGVGGFFAAIPAGLVWGSQLAFGTFGVGVVVGVIQASIIMVRSLNHRAELQSQIVYAQTTKIINESEAQLSTARTREIEAQQRVALPAPQPQPLLPAPSAIQTTGTFQALPPEKIRVWVVPPKGHAQAFECATKLVQWAIADCWPIAAREYATSNGEKVRIWKHRDQDFTEAAQFMVRVGAWVERGTTFEWREGMTQPLMIEWFRSAMRNNGDAGLPASLSSAHVMMNAS